MSDERLTPGYLNDPPTTGYHPRQQMENEPALDYLRSRVRDAEARIAALEAEAARLRAAGEWVLNTASGVGKNGGPPEPGEVEAALDALKEAL